MASYSSLDAETWAFTSEWLSCAYADYLSVYRNWTQRMKPFDVLRESSWRCLVQKEEPDDLSIVGLCL